MCLYILSNGVLAMFVKMKVLLMEYHSKVQLDCYRLLFHN